ncbi:hypothetical protein [Oscillatoria acuminata]|uniref:hypothetical protein n=1 Tax=Oscillatoria acuminata TaxID=118323 RepID=UPI0012EA7B0C|nr:hypothetical protein [Oscillatoria acuminata]
MSETLALLALLSLGRSPGEHSLQLWKNCGKLREKTRVSGGKLTDTVKILCGKMRQVFHKFSTGGDEGKLRCRKKGDRAFATG